MANKSVPLIMRHFNSRLSAKLLGTRRAAAAQTTKDHREEERAAWDHIDALFAFRENLEEELAQGHSYLHDVSIRKVDAIINEALCNLLREFGKDPRTTSGENLVKVFKPKGQTGEPEAMLLKSADWVFELIEFKEQNLTDAEFKAVVAKLGAAQAGRKWSDEALARRLGTSRVDFLNTFKNARDKILRYWAERVRGVNRAAGHAEDHRELARVLAEENLEGKEKHEAEKNLLSCPWCLEEYNRYRKLFHLMTGPTYFDRWKKYLQARNSQRYDALEQLVSQLVGPEEEDPAPHTSQGTSVSLPLWRNLTLVLLALFITVGPVTIYQMVRLKKQLADSQAYNKSLSAAEEEGRHALVYSRQKIDELNKTVRELSHRDQTLAAELDELRQRPAEGLKPDGRTVLSVPFTPFHYPGDLQIIKIGREARLLNFRVGVSVAKDYETYELIIADSRGKALWQVNKVEKDPQGDFTFPIETRLLKPGDYVLRIYGQDHRQKSLVAQRRFRVTLV